MTMNDPQDKVQMIGVDGRVRSVPSYLRESLLKEGFKMIYNAKEEYYPNYDVRNTDYQSKDMNIIEDIEPSEYLEVEKI